MARKSYYRVARCQSDGTLALLDAEHLNEFVAQELARIGAIASARLQARIAIELGLTCCASGHPMKAIIVWAEALKRLSEADDRWLTIDINRQVTTWSALTSRHEAMRLAGLIDRVVGEIGLPALAGCRQAVSREYRDKWLDKYYESAL